ncbi:serine/threonine-protein kinase [Streptomyces sp. NPDC091272]|uniref:serine/threonine-protein kinase n=1 Tax=Streptomyces sp. NPDC091272 TaxID=3365981 RepID=UPI00382F6BE0
MVTGYLIYGRTYARGATGGTVELSWDGVGQPLQEKDPPTVGGYRLVAKLGAGGMGEVYLSHTPGGRAVALKVIRPHLTGDPEFRRRFRLEVRAARQVAALHTAPVIDAETEGDTPWLATAYVPGPSLAEAVTAHGPLPVDSVLLLVAGVAEALQAIHACGIVHRDLKPSNVLLAPDGPRVIDFGIAHAAGSLSLTAAGIAVGTPAFMSPEQAEGGPISWATDVFSLGLVASYAAGGSPAFGEGTPHGVLYRIVHEAPRIGAVPPSLHELITRCLAKDPAARPTTTEVIGLCRAAAGGAGLRRAENWLPPALTAAITARPQPPAAAPAPEPPSAPATPPGVFGPPAAQPYGYPAAPPHHPHQPQPQPQPQPPPLSQGYAAYAYPQPNSPHGTPASGAFAGPSSHPGAPTGPVLDAKPRTRPRRAVAMGTAAAVLAVGALGAGAAYLLGENDRGGSTPAGQPGSTRQPGPAEEPPATYPPGPEASSAAPESLDTRKTGTPAPPLSVPPSARRAVPEGERRSP